MINSCENGPKFLPLGSVKESSQPVNCMYVIYKLIRKTERNQISALTNIEEISIIWDFAIGSMDTMSRSFWKFSI